MTFLPLPTPKEAVVAIVASLLLDYAWFGIMYSTYKALIESVQKTPFIARYVFVAAAYLFIAGLLVVFALPLFDLSRWYPFLLGALTYGMFNFTNLAIFDKYALSTGLTDTVWGGVMFFLSCMIAKSV